MPDGIALPTPFPPACIAVNAIVIDLVDDGSTISTAPESPADSTITQTYRVTGLDDTNNAIGSAINAVLVAYPSPTYQPYGACMVPLRIEPAIGIDGVRRQSMISGRGSTDENNTTGTEAVFRVVYGFPSSLGGVTTYEFLQGGIVYDENPLDPLESTGQLILQVKGPTTAAAAKAQAIAAFPTHPNNASLVPLKSSVRYAGGGTCASVWIVTLGYGCASAQPYDIVGSDVQARSASLTIRNRGQASMAAALSAAIAANPTHPTASCMYLSGTSANISAVKCDGDVVEITLRYTDEIESDFISYTENTLDTLESTGQVSVGIYGATTSALAKAAAVALFPTHPDNASLGIIGTSVKYDGTLNCAASANWTVVISYGCVKARAYGVVGNDISVNTASYPKSSGSLTIRQRGQASLDAAISAAQAAYPTHPDLSGIPLTGRSAATQENACDGLVTTVTLQYSNPSSGSGTSGTGDAGTLELAEYTTVIEQRSSYIKAELWASTTPLTLDSDYDMNERTPGVYEKREVLVPLFRFRVPWNTSTTLLTWAITMAGSTNSNTYSIGGHSWPANTLRMNGVHEVVVKNNAGVIKHINVIEIDACTRGFLTEEPDFSTGKAKVKKGYFNTTFTVPTPASIP